MTGGDPVIGVGLLGCGTIGPLHAEALARVEGARLVAVADLLPERAAALAKAYDVRAVSDLRQLLAVPGVDLVSVCTPSGTHAALGVEIASAGRHVVVEKPIDVRLDAADALVEAADRSGVVLSVISQHRFDAGVVRLRRALRRGVLGPITLAEGRTWWYRTQAYYDADDWRGTDALDGGALMNQGIHVADLLAHLLGPVESVFARARTVAHEMQAEDLLVATLAFESGALGILSVTTASFPGVPETLAVSGSQASVVLEAGSVVSWRQQAVAGEAVAGGDGAGGDEAEQDAATEPGERPGTAALGSRDLSVDAHRAQLQDVVDAVREGRAPAVTGADGRRALALVRAAYASARSGKEARVG